MRLYSIDPGYDNVGFAWFDVEIFQDSQFTMGLATAQAAMYSMRAMGEFPLTGSPEQRIRTISLSLVGMSIEERGAVVLIEVPAIDANYSRHSGRKMQKSLNKLWMSIGAIAAAVSRPSGPQVHFIPADTRPKSERYALMEPVAEEMGVELHRGARGGIRHDVWDAVELGWRSLATGMVEPHDARARGGDDG